MSINAYGGLNEWSSIYYQILNYWVRVLDDIKNSLAKWPLNVFFSLHSLDFYIEICCREGCSMSCVAAWWCYISALNPSANLNAFPSLPPCPIQFTCGWYVLERVVEGGGVVRQSGPLSYNPILFLIQNVLYV